MEDEVRVTTHKGHLLGRMGSSQGSKFRKSWRSSGEEHLICLGKKETASMTVHCISSVGLKIYRLVENIPECVVCEGLP